MRRRILVSMVLVTAAAVIAFAVPLGILAARLYRGREVSRLEHVAIGAIGANSLPRPPNGVDLALYDASGRRTAGVGPDSASSEVLDALGGQLSNDHDGGSLAVAVPVRRLDTVVGAVRAATAWDVVADDTYVSWLAMAALAAAAVAVAGGLAWWQSSRLVSPVEDLSRFAIRLGDGDFGARVSTFGIRELDTAGGALNRTAERLSTLVGRERAFTADVSHQLNTPLTSLRLALEEAMLRSGADHDALEVALQEVDRLQRTVTTLLSVARDEPGRQLRAADVIEVCRDVAERNRSRVEGAGRDLRVDLPLALPAARCQPDVLAEILAVLLDNALVHGAGTVTIAARTAGRGAVVDVSDEGPGILTPAGSLFERRSPDATGHGIGLALAHALAIAHDARLDLARAAPCPVFSLALAPADDGVTPSGPAAGK